MNCLVSEGAGAGEVIGSTVGFNCLLHNSIILDHGDLIPLPLFKFPFMGVAENQSWVS